MDSVIRVVKQLRQHLLGSLPVPASLQPAFIPRLIIVGFGHNESVQAPHPGLLGVPVGWLKHGIFVRIESELQVVEAYIL